MCWWWLRGLWPLRPADHRSCGRLLLVGPRESRRCVSFAGRLPIKQRGNGGKQGTLVPFRILPRESPCLILVPTATKLADALAFRDQARMSCQRPRAALALPRSEEHTSELQSLMRISYAVFC